MKTKNLKSLISLAVIILLIILSGAVTVTAATPAPATTRPRPGSGTSVTETSDNRNNSENSNNADDSGRKETSSTPNSSTPSANTSAGSSSESRPTTVTVAETEAPAQPKVISEKKYTTRRGAFGWFLLSVIINSFLSFSIGSRFYKMSKKDTHVISEIRALRKDVEEKFAENVGGFSESKIDIVNSNENYSIDDGGLKTTASNDSEDSSESAEETFKRWERRLAEQRAEKRSEVRASLPRNTNSTQNFVEGTGNKSSHIKSYQPRRDSYTTDNTDYDNTTEEDSAIDSIKNKAKELITEIFPFKED